MFLSFYFSTKVILLALLYEDIGLLPPVIALQNSSGWCETRKDCCYGYYLVDNKCKECEPGTFGLNCTGICKPGTYGRFCAEICDCRGNEICQPTVGCVEPMMPTAGAFVENVTFKDYMIFGCLFLLIVLMVIQIINQYCIMCKTKEKRREISSFELPMDDPDEWSNDIYVDGIQNAAHINARTTDNSNYFNHSIIV